jgi:hypothetical protein
VASVIQFDALIWQTGGELPIWMLTMIGDTDSAQNVFKTSAKSPKKATQKIRQKQNDPPQSGQESLDTVGEQWNEQYCDRCVGNEGSMLLNVRQGRNKPAAGPGFGYSTADSADESANLHRY